ncbi:apolipoprotein N-acyltransferase [Acidithiobacillus caldus]|uniref:Apolipoprotein N-acyltransferase n=1 Tax=Acidithiobacillus caldus (strain ATCC 51756 / DSM 8584 / KU) TaxID=637389 RepID=A0A059ZVG5_ACICK|nr:apolipoprotein N-acyltransferase [Acidithiobacillus caldus]AIA55600.1 Apolipoprotein N-acyltransferase / Copper homeostasis protein CutE [Acidithiobacillus caldus ATCC 51756]MBU2730814.1 apolipoprotein N-acyltransferase [Acidithiobacillus caldus]MBU2736480.1 apolipoprotein N-acyltransferase [Acidithiobacillus caldus ATCC 51756]MBU2745134.1 apolipoprotein N-acyltransferase [Acidithiobacillus caldus]MBU2778743.1 apolipoprotein N-acyltransferase [Acidithiobacillus caldus]
MKKGLRLRWRWGLAVALGACWPLAFAPFDLSFLTIALLLALFWLIDGVTPSAAATIGFAFGFGAFAAGIYWLAIPLHNYAHMSWLLSAAAVALLALYCAIYPALSLWVAAKWWAHSRLFALPFLWIGAEWLQAHLFTGFPWLATGYSQTWSLLGGWAPLLGQYGVGLATAGVAALLLFLIRHRANRRKAVAAIGGIVLLYTGAAFSQDIQRTARMHKQLTVRLIQGDVPVTEKWNVAKLSAVLDTYVKLILATPKGTNLVVLPETAFPVFQTQVPGLLRNLQRWSAEHHTNIILGIVEYAKHHYYNAALDIDGLAPWHWYRKQHLVPFGEYIPFPQLLAPLVHHFLPGLGSFTPGDGPSTLNVKGLKAGMTICYEESFSRDVRKGVTQGASFLTNISDYSWFGHSTALPQSLQMAAMQAREEEKPDIRSTNTGVTAIISPGGKIQDKLPAYFRGALNGKISPRKGKTPFGDYGDWPFLIGSFLVLTILRVGWKDHQLLHLRRKESK